MAGKIEVPDRLNAFEAAELLVHIRERMKGFGNPYDEEAAHQDADKVLLSLLRHTGYSDVVAAFENIPRWYA